jgi:tRNA threonylcarbamoyl adenosine modification protein YeaZ
MRPMTTLFLDFASHEKSLALVADGKTIELKKIDDHADESALLPMIEALVAKTGKIDRIAATTGPGGFMSLRVGLSIANALAWGWNIPAAGVHLSDVWAARAKDASCVWTHSTKKDLLFLRGFGDFKKAWPETVLISPAELSAKITAKTPYIGELIEAQQTMLPALERMTDVMPLEEVLPSIVNALTYEKKEVMPWYGRGA